MQAQVNIKGLNELLTKLKNFAPNIQNNVARGAIVGAALVIRDAARAGVPVDTTTLQKNIVASRSRGRKDVVASKVRVRPLTAKRLAKLKGMGAKGKTTTGKYKGDAWYGYIVHYGTFKKPGGYLIPYKGRTHRSGKTKLQRALGIKGEKYKTLWWPGASHPVAKVKHPGMKGVPYLKTAWESSHAAALGRFVQRLRVGIAQEARKRR